MFKYEVPDNVIESLQILVPPLIANEMTCFVFYDDHPRDPKNIDLIVGTALGEVKVIHSRNVISSIQLQNDNLDAIKIYRNNKCELFYLVSSDSTLFILSHIKHVAMHKIIENVDSYSIKDPMCTGQVSLKILCNGDAVPIMLDDDLIRIQDRVQAYNVKPQDTIPLVTHLQRKLCEAKYNVHLGEKTLNNYRNIRQLAAFSMNEKQRLNAGDAVFKLSSEIMAADLNVKSLTPWVRVCNQRVILIFEIKNTSLNNLENVHVLLHDKSNDQNSIVYTTKLFERQSPPPYWVEKSTTKMSFNRETALVTVINLKEIAGGIKTKIKLNGVICYKHNGEEQNLLPFKEVSISISETRNDALDILSEADLGKKVALDILSEADLGDPNVMLAVIATTQFNVLKLRIIDTSMDISVHDIFCKYVKMQPVLSSLYVFIHRHSPYHPLNGMMVILKIIEGTAGVMVWVYSREPNQLISLIEIIYDAVPARVVITPQNCIIKAKNRQLMSFNESAMPPRISPASFTNCASSISEQLCIILEYLESCDSSMTLSKKPRVLQNFGRQIDIFVDGPNAFIEFRKKILEEAMKGILCFEYDTEPTIAANDNDVE